MVDFEESAIVLKWELQISCLYVHRLIAPFILVEDIGK